MGMWAHVHPEYFTITCASMVKSYVHYILQYIYMGVSHPGTHWFPVEINCQTTTMTSTTTTTTTTTTATATKTQKRNATTWPTSSQVFFVGWILFLGLMAEYTNSPTWRKSNLWEVLGSTEELPKLPLIFKICLKFMTGRRRFLQRVIFFIFFGTFRCYVFPFNIKLMLDHFGKIQTNKTRKTTSILARQIGFLLQASHPKVSSPWKSSRPLDQK